MIFSLTLIDHSIHSSLRSNKKLQLRLAPTVVLVTEHVIIAVRKSVMRVALGTTHVGESMHKSVMGAVSHFKAVGMQALGTVAVCLKESLARTVVRDTPLVIRQVSYLFVHLVLIAHGLDEMPTFFIICRIGRCLHYW